MKKIRFVVLALLGGLLTSAYAADAAPAVAAPVPTIIQPVVAAPASTAAATGKDVAPVAKSSKSPAKKPVGKGTPKPKVKRGTQH